MKLLSIDLKEYSSYDFSLSYREEIPCVEMKIEGFMEGEDFRRNTLKMLALLKEKNTGKLLVKAQNMKFIRSEDCTWLEKVFLPFAISGGFKACAFVRPLDYHARLTIENVIYTIPAPLMEAAWFDEEERAESWLKNV